MEFSRYGGPRQTYQDNQQDIPEAYGRNHWGLSQKSLEPHQGYGALQPEYGDWNYSSSNHSGLRKQSFSPQKPFSPYSRYEEERPEESYIGGKGFLEFKEPPLASPYRQGPTSFATAARESETPYSPGPDFARSDSAYRQQHAESLRRPTTANRSLPTPRPRSRWATGNLNNNMAGILPGATPSPNPSKVGGHDTKKAYREMLQQQIEEKRQRKQAESDDRRRRSRDWTVGNIGEVPAQPFSSPHGRTSNQSASEGVEHHPVGGWSSSRWQEQGHPTARPLSARGKHGSQHEDFHSPNTQAGDHFATAEYTGPRPATARSPDLQRNSRAPPPPSKDEKFDGMSRHHWEDQMWNQHVNNVNNGQVGHQLADTAGHDSANPFDPSQMRKNVDLQAENEIQGQRKADAEQTRREGMEAMAAAAAAEMEQMRQELRQDQMRLQALVEEQAKLLRDLRVETESVRSTRAQLQSQNEASSQDRNRDRSQSSQGQNHSRDRDLLSAWAGEPAAEDTYDSWPAQSLEHLSTELPTAETLFRRIVQQPEREDAWTAHNRFQETRAFESDTGSTKRMNASAAEADSQFPVEQFSPESLSLEFQETESRSFPPPAPLTLSPTRETTHRSSHEFSDLEHSLDSESFLILLDKADAGKEERALDNTDRDSPPLQDSHGKSGWKGEVSTALFLQTPQKLDQKHTQKEIDFAHEGEPSPASTVKEGQESVEHPTGPFGEENIDSTWSTAGLQSTRTSPVFNQQTSGHLQGSVEPFRTLESGRSSDNSMDLGLSGNNGPAGTESTIELSSPSERTATEESGWALPLSPLSMQDRFSVNEEAEDTADDEDDVGLLSINEVDQAEMYIDSLGFATKQELESLSISSDEAGTKNSVEFSLELKSTLNAHSVNSEAADSEGKQARQRFVVHAPTPVQRAAMQRMIVYDKIARSVPKSKAIKGPAWRCRPAQSARPALTGSNASRIGFAVPSTRQTTTPSGPALRGSPRVGSEATTSTHEKSQLSPKNALEKTVLQVESRKEESSSNYPRANAPESLPTAALTSISRNKLSLGQSEQDISSRVVQEDIGNGILEQDWKEEGFTNLGVKSHSDGVSHGEIQAAPDEKTSSESAEENDTAYGADNLSRGAKIDTSKSHKSGILKNDEGDAQESFSIFSKMSLDALLAADEEGNSTEGFASSDSETDDSGGLFGDFGSSTPSRGEEVSLKALRERWKAQEIDHSSKLVHEVPTVQQEAKLGAKGQRQDKTPGKKRWSIVPSILRRKSKD